MHKIYGTQLIPCRDIDDQKILQINWLRAFYNKIEEPDFSQICSFHNYASSWDKKRHQQIEFLPKTERSYFLGIFYVFPTVRIFLKDLALSIFEP